MCTESVQKSLEKKFGKAGGSIPITPSDSFEKRMGVSINPVTTLLIPVLYCFRFSSVLLHWAHFTVCRFMCVYQCVYCVFLFHTA